MSGLCLPLDLWDPVSTHLGVEAWQLQALPMMGRYELIYPLGSGQSGVVFEAFDTHLDRYVALKRFNKNTPPEQVYTEASVLARVDHPNVIALHGLGFEAERAYLVTDLIHGGTLRSRAKASRGWCETLGWCIQAAHGLAAIHAEGFVHNDIKPVNILVDHSGHARVIDVGLSAPAGEPHRGGTKNYLAPERLLLGMGTTLSDQYSLARAIGWSLLSGGDLHDVPLRLWLVLHQAMAWDPGARFASIADFTAALEQVGLQNSLRADGGRDE